MTQTHLHTPVSGSTSAHIQTWLVDFDETLAVSHLSWVFQHLFPQFSREHQLDYDEGRLHQVLLVLQERSRQNPDTAQLLAVLFEEMEWPSTLLTQFSLDLQSSYTPSLFEDSVPFLERLYNSGRHIYIISNNRHTPKHIQLFGIDKYIRGVFTPHNSPDTQPKPHSSLWNYITAHHTDINPATTVVIGDDPWSDGAFAQACSLPCWIVDRTQRFSDMYKQKPYHWVQSLLDIPI